MADPPAGRVLGIDAGERRIGVAISDPGRSFALPLETLPADGTEMERLAAIVAVEGVSELVVGLPLSLSGEASVQTERARAFAKQVEEALHLPVHLWDERLTSVEAQRVSSHGREPPGRRRSHRQRPSRTAPEAQQDSVAASIILQAYLDRLRFEST